MKQSENNTIYGTLVIERGKNEARFELEKPIKAEYHGRTYQINFIPLNIQRLKERLPQLKENSRNSYSLSIPYETFKPLARDFLRDVERKLIERSLDESLEDEIIEGILKEIDEKH